MSRVRVAELALGLFLGYLLITVFNATVKAIIISTVSEGLFK